jgi:hypothetical protein
MHHPNGREKHWPCYANIEDAQAARQRIGSVPP